MEPARRKPIGVRRILAMAFSERRESLAAADRLMEDLDAIIREPGPDGDLESIGELGENDAPMVRLVNLIVAQAVQKRATEILIEPSSTSLVVRYRVGSQLQVAMNPPVTCASPMKQPPSWSAGLFSSRVAD